MKTKRNPRLKSASALLVSLFLMTILAVSIGGYLTYTEQQTFLGMRAQAWNMAMAVSEAGIEEGLQQLNNNWTNLSTDGWSANGSVYSMSRTFNGATYTASIDFADTMSPTITSRSSVNGYNFAKAPPSFMFAIASVNVTSTNKTLSRAVRVRTSRSALFTGAMVAKHKIDMNGNNILTDSFDSADSAKSTDGRYDPSKAGDHGDIASNDGVVNTIEIGNANIYGKVYTGPGGTATIGVAGGVGDHAWQAANDGIQPGWYFNNANFTFPRIHLPYNSGLDPGPKDVVVISGSISNEASSFVNVTTLPNPAPGQIAGPVTTNIIRSTSSVHPGQQPGLTTNTIWNTTSTHPGNQTGVTTNYTGFTTTTTYPGSQPQLRTNCANAPVRVKDQPTIYCGQAPWTSGADNNWWFYYPIASYTYASSFTYTYPTYSYTYNTFTYTYTIYNSTPTYVTNHYDHVLENGDYYTTDLHGKTIVTGTARLVLPDGLKMSGNDELTIAPGGSLTLYSGGDSMTIGGNGILNKSGYAANFVAYATPSVTSVTFNGNGEFIGVLVAGEADVRMNGAGTLPIDFIGSLLVNSVQMNGLFKFHYDEALSRLNNTGRFLITSWDEIK